MSRAFGEGDSMLSLCHGPFSNDNSYEERRKTKRNVKKIEIYGNSCISCLLDTRVDFLHARSGPSGDLGICIDSLLSDFVKFQVNELNPPHL